jgi:uncharacterized membrane protein YdbT with pleckstrin-like domain
LSYLETIVGPGEHVLYTGRVSIFAILSSLLGGLLLIAIGIGVSLVNPLGLIIAIPGVLVIIAAVIRRTSTELAVTNRRVIAKFGFISRNTVELNLAKVESIRVDQSVMGRLFNYGSIVVTGTGSTMDPIPFISDPIGFRKAVQGASDTVQKT